ncbi:MAG: hypothetical protein Q8904_15810 [Bacteroidota bacterium]|nr:hypothetical protein [Bacteroidota bacterium]
MSDLKCRIKIIEQSPLSVAVMFLLSSYNLPANNSTQQDPASFILSIHATCWT